MIKTNDLVAVLRDICYANTKAYRGDFDKDVEIIMSEVEKPENERNTLLWLSYPCGTRTLYEPEVFLKDTPANISWLYYHEQEEQIIAYAVVVEGVSYGKVSGRLYDLDYAQHCARVRERAVPSHYLEYICENGPIKCLSKDVLKVVERMDLGKILGCRWLADDEKAHSVVLATERLLRDGSVPMSMVAKEIIEKKWRKDRERLEAGKECLCLRCGNVLDEKLSMNAKSRHADIYICDKCGTDEAMKDWYGKPLPFCKWNGYPQKRECISPSTLLLLPACSFPEVFKKKDISTGAPFSEVAYSRSDYDGYQWWTNWFLRGDKLGSPLSEEIDGFMNSLFKMPEFKDLKTMRHARVNAESTGDTTEYNLYSETYSFYVWVRMITREKDYNLYVHYLRKDKV